jgi:hypothetical protein
MARGICMLEFIRAFTYVDVFPRFNENSLNLARQNEGALLFAIFYPCIFDLL